jgi:hypothetical protein
MVSAASVLTVPVAAAALVLVVAGLGKLRSPAAAIGALRSAGLFGGTVAVRLAALGELALGGWALSVGGRAPALVMAGAYAGFACLGSVLARRASACGCFGDAGGLASGWQASVSVGLTLVCGAAAVAGSRSLMWWVGRGSPLEAVEIAVATCAGAYAVVVAYLELPGAFRAWSAS